jgi:F-type H+-transporting ATPase subunit delta
MTTRGSASRYARALLDVAISESITDRADRDLSRFADLLAQYPQLANALTHPAVPAARKQALTQALASRLELTTPVTKLLLMLADRDRLALLPDLVQTYRDRLMDHQQVVRAEVTTAEPLASSHAQELQERLARATGRHVTLSTKVDPAIIGGMVARIGSTVYDGSLAAQLTKLREKLAGES